MLPVGRLMGWSGGHSRNQVPALPLLAVRWPLSALAGPATSPTAPHLWPALAVQRLTEDVFATCLRSGDYMQLKNALLLLNRCVGVSALGSWVVGGGGGDCVDGRLHVHVSPRAGARGRS